MRLLGVFLREAFSISGLRWRTLALIDSTLKAEWLVNEHGFLSTFQNKSAQSYRGKKRVEHLRFSSLLNFPAI